jgi:hypothetical protein
LFVSRYIHQNQKLIILFYWGHHVRDHMVVILISAQDEVYLTQHYVIKIVRDLQQVGGFLHQ